MTKDQLREYRCLIRNIEHIEDELQRIRDTVDAKSVIISDMPKGSDMRDKMLEAITSIIELEYKMIQQLGECSRKRMEIESAINKLPQREQQLIRLRYVDGLAWENICVEMSYSWQQTHNIHNKALRCLGGVGC
jgi:DNA-directed RNA polymerase specialized sigma24 family protein